MDQSKKELILIAATSAFSRLGFKKTSIDEIAALAGVAKGTVYLACESKEDLFYQALHREVRAWVAVSARLIDPRVPADQLLAIVAEAGVRQLETAPLTRDLLLGRYFSLFPGSSGWEERLDGLRQLGQANVVEILKLGIRQGRFRKNIDAEQVATLLQDLQFTTYLFHNRAEGREQRLARRSLAGFDLILNGLRDRDFAEEAPHRKHHVKGKTAR